MNDDLVQLFATPPAPPSQDVRFRQGEIITFDQITLENTVNVGDTVLTNLPLQGVGEATLLVPGAVVGILSVGDAAKTMFIAGRIVKPDTVDATSAVSLLNSQIFSNFIAAGETCSSTTYGDLTTVGPRVIVPVGPTGRILVVATAQMQWATGFAVTERGDGRFDLEFTGANSRSPVEANDPLVGVASVATTGDIADNSNVGVFSTTTQAIFAGLNPGNTTITMKYRLGPSSTANVDFFRRTLTVFKL